VLKSCLTPGCPNLTEASRCDNCRRADRRRRRRDPSLTGGAARNDNRRSYQKVRRRALVRDEFRCRDCGGVGDLVVHHVDGDARNHTLENLVTLCPRCHWLRHR
jgi:5-methylcytosine-specific restriction endonuclease McrA